MKTFDYVRAWDHVAAPAVDSLSGALLGLVNRAAEAGRNCMQDAACDLKWPEESAELRAELAAVPAADLAFAAQAVHNFGHWKHSRSELGAAWRELLSYGGHWRFSHYVDQILRERFSVSNGYRETNGWSLQIHEGAVRLCWASRHSWTWAEVAPADEDGMTAARELQAAAQRKTSMIPRNHLRKRDHAAYLFVEGLRTLDTDEKRAADAARWPERWRPFVDMSAYMVEEDELKAREAQHSDRRQTTIADLAARRDKTIAKANAEYARLSWLAERGISLDNVIYYEHKNTVCFGWRQPVSHEVTSQLLDLLCEYPYPYEIKSATRGIISTVDQHEAAEAVTEAIADRLRPGL